MSTQDFPALQQRITDWLTREAQGEGREDMFTWTETHGLLCALACGPQPPSDWPAHILSDRPPAPDVREALDELLDRIAARLGAGDSLALPCRLDPFEDREGRDLASWCAGFIAGVFLREQDWFADDEEGMARRLLPFMLISGLDEDPELDRLWEDERLVREMASSIPGVLEEIFLHFHAPSAPE